MGMTLGPGTAGVVGQVGEKRLTHDLGEVCETYRYLETDTAVDEPVQTSSG